MQLEARPAGERHGAAGRRAPTTGIAAISLVSALLAACSVYDIRPRIDPFASIGGGVRYEDDLLLCQERIAATPQQSSAVNGGMGVLAAAAIGGGIAGGGAAMFGGNTRNAAGLGALAGAGAGFSAWGASLAAGTGMSDRLRVDLCLQERGYTVVWPNGARLTAFDPPLER